jgi:hypothetical protein
MNLRALLFALAAAGPAWGQFELYLVNGNIEQPVGQAYNFGNVEPGGSLAVPFRIRNIGAAAATLDLLTVSGAGFSLANVAPAIPVSLPSQQTVDFTVVFQSAGSGSYSAALESVGISVIVSATVPVELTCEWVTGTGVQALAAGPANFGSVPLTQNATIEILLLNQTSSVLTAPGAVVTGTGFSLDGPSAGGKLVLPAASVAFEIQFIPTAAGVMTGTLAIGDRSYVLTGTGTDPPFPQPQIVVTLPQSESAQQGTLESDQQYTVAINLSAASLISGMGTVTLTFVPEPSLAGTPADPGIAFASGGQSTTFAVFIGATAGNFDAQATISFQTGTTAGTLTIAVQLGSNSTQQSFTILPAVVGLTAVAGVRSASTVEVDLTGYDNTRTAGALSFTFYDAVGNALAPAIQASASAVFASYFQNAAGGTFALKAVFQVVGDTTQIAAFQAVVTNSAGSATTAQVSF